MNQSPRTLWPIDPAETIKGDDIRATQPIRSDHSKRVRRSRYGSRSFSLDKTWRGSFFAFNDSSYGTTHYRGGLQNADFSIALACWNDIQIELITQRCETPSVYREFLDEGREGFHHVLTTTDDMEALLVDINRDGLEVVTDSDIGENGRVIYLRMAEQQWPLIEVGEFTPAIHEIFDMVKEASIGWDGGEPLRVLG